MRNRWVWFILSVALAVRLALVAVVWTPPESFGNQARDPLDRSAFTPDSESYWGLSQMLSKGEGFDSPALAEVVDGKTPTGTGARVQVALPTHSPEIFRTPGIPPFLLCRILWARRALSKRGCRLEDLSGAPDPFRCRIGGNHHSAGPTAALVAGGTFSGASSGDYAGGSCVLVPGIV